MKIKTAIFDLDGTLLDTLGDLADSVNAALQRHGFPPATEEQVRERVGNGVRMLVARCLPQDAEDALIDACLDDFRTVYDRRMMNRTQPYEGILRVLKTLKKEGVAVGVLSNKYDLAAKGLVRHYFGDLCQITCGEKPDVPRKPDPSSTLQLLRELGGNPATTLYIGDSSTDMQTAKNAGLTAVGVAWGFRSAESLLEAGADALAHRPSDLLPLFEHGVFNAAAIGSTFTARGFGFTYFPTAQQALPYLAEACRGKTVSLGGSMTLRELGVSDALADGSDLHWHWLTPGDYKQDAEVYLTSANALSETGEIVNIDGNCNRVAGTLFGPKRCIFVCGVNKLCDDLTSAIWRVRNVAAPMNAKRLSCKTPCAIDGKCHDCRSADRICSALVVHMAPPKGMEACEIVLIGETLGY